jgi:hypothetical protein
MVNNESFWSHICQAQTIRVNLDGKHVSNAIRFIMNNNIKRLHLIGLYDIDDDIEDKSIFQDLFDYITDVADITMEIDTDYYESFLEQLDNKRFQNLRSIKGVTETLFNKIMPGCDGDKIETLEMSGAILAPKSYKLLNNMKSLERLRFYCTSFDDLTWMENSCPKLLVSEFHSPNSLLLGNLSAIATNLKHLSLIVTGFEELKDKVIFKNLETLKLTGPLYVLPIFLEVQQPSLKRFQFEYENSICCDKDNISCRFVGQPNLEELIIENVEEQDIIHDIIETCDASLSNLSIIHCCKVPAVRCRQLISYYNDNDTSVTIMRNNRKTLESLKVFSLHQVKCLYSNILFPFSNLKTLAIWRYIPMENTRLKSVIEA